MTLGSIRQAQRTRRVGEGTTPIAGRAASRRRVVRSIAVVIFALLFVCSGAHADVGVVLNDSLGRGITRITGSGHSGVYFSHICAASPVELRLCSPGEEGAVISTYGDFGQDYDFEWNIVPLSVYLYGVENFEDRPLFASAQIKNLLEERYRATSLVSYCSGPSCATSNKGQWRAMVGAALNRTVYIFVVATTVEQDLEFIAKFNARPNDNRFNGISRNCADFTREIVNTYFPKATRRNYLNDFGMTSPKGISRSFVRYARSHPDSQFRVLHFPQLPGTIKRSSVARAGTEQLFRSKKLLVPMLVVTAHAAAASALTYFFTGRFNAQREMERFPAARAGELEHQRKIAKSQKDAALAERLGAEQKYERSSILGSPEEWDRYRQTFGGIVDEAVRIGVLPARKTLSDALKNLDQRGTPVLGENGALWMEIPEGGGISRVGLNAKSIFAADSDPRLAYQLMLARIDAALKSPPRNRPAMATFTEDWALLEQVQARMGMPHSSAALH